MVIKIFILLLSTSFTLSCGVRFDTELFESSAMENSAPLRIALQTTGPAQKELSIFVSANIVDVSQESLSYCISSECNDPFQWKTATPLGQRPGLFKINHTLTNSQELTLDLRLMREGSSISGRKVRITQDQGEINPDQPNNPEESACYKADKFTCEIELAIHKYTNEYRHRAGLPALSFHAKTGFVSRDWSRQQAASGRIGHAGFVAQRHAVYRKEFGTLDTAMARENVAMSGGLGGNADQIAKRFADMWYYSPGHRANMLARGINTHGAGVYKRSSGTYYATQIFGNSR